MIKVLFQRVSNAFIIKGTSGILNIVMLMLVSQSMPAKEFGIFGLSFSIALIGSIIANSGMSTLVMRLVPESISKKDNYAKAESISWTSKTTFFFGLLISMVFLFFFLIGNFLELTISFSLIDSLWLTFFIFIMSYSDYVSGLLRSQKKVLAALLPKDIFWRIILILYLFYCSYKKMTLSAADVILFLAVSLFLLTLIQIFSTRLHKSLSFRFYENLRIDWFKMALPIWASTILFAFTANLDVIVLGFLISEEKIAAYFASIKIASFLALPILAVNQLSGPEISKHFYAKEYKNLNSKLRFFSSFCLIISIPIIVVILAFGKQLLYYFNPEFVSAYPVLLIVSGAYLFHSMSGPAGMLLQMTGNSTKVLKVSTLTQLCSIILLPFSATFGILGISFVRFFEWGTRNITLALICFYIYKLNTSIIGLLKK